MQTNHAIRLLLVFLLLPTGCYLLDDSAPSPSDSATGSPTASAPRPATPPRARGQQILRTETLELGNDVALEIVRVPGGTFRMGGTQSPEDVAGLFGGQADSYLDEQPVHRVELSSFWMGRTEVTLQQFAAFVLETGYETRAEADGWGYVFKGSAWEGAQGIDWIRPGFEQEGDHPVVCIAWEDTIAFCAWLSARTGRRCRLPSEAQWEYAARGGAMTAFPWGDVPAAGVGHANAADQTALKQFPGRKAFPWDDGFVYTAPVGSFRPNAFGLFDMTGNVWEWCADVYAPDAYANSKLLNPTGPLAGDKRVLRGGCWLNDPGGCRIADRNGWPAPTDAYGGYGFRIVVVE